MSYCTVDQVKSMFRCLDDVTDPAVTDAEIQEFIDENCAAIDGCINELYLLPITGDGPGLPEISTVETVADVLGSSFVVWDTLTAGATDDGNGGISGGGTGVADLSKSDANGALSGVDFVLTYEVDGLNIPSDFFIGLSSNNTVNDFGTFTGFIIPSGGGSTTDVFENGNVGSSSFTSTSNNIFEFARTGTNFTFKIDGVTKFTTNSASAIAAYPMVRLKGASGVITSSYTGVGASSLNNKYFLYNTPAMDYAFYNNIDGAGSAPSVATTEIPVPAAGGAADTVMSAALQVAMDAQTDITATVLGNLVTATNVAGGNVTDAADVDTGFTVTTTQQGTASTVGDSPKSFLILQKLLKMKTAAVLDDILNTYSESDKKPTWGKQAAELLEKICPSKNPRTCKRCEPTMKLPDATFLGANRAGDTIAVKATTGVQFRKGVDSW